MQTTVKVAVSLPREQFRLAEKRRRALRVSRSAMVREAIHQWLKSFEEERAIRQYIDGYRRHPQSPQEVDAMERAAAEALRHEAW
ncbi:MAG: ribbon-helix-helix protein, CopG family [Candidatus Omnitrophota bacterium]|nr:ribbon-helix-helix protein, CopG family [Candidatus Omnitrophota bacterium]